MFGMNSVKTVAAAGFLALSAGSAQALTCSIDNVFFTLDTSADVECVSGNDLGANGIVATDKELFDLTGWLLGDSSDGSAAVTGAVEFDDMPEVDVDFGIWSILDYNGFDPLMIVLKSGDQYAAFKITEAISGLFGTWSITEYKCSPPSSTDPDDCGDDPKDLSHTSLYHQPSAVPVPAAGLLLLGALGGLAALRRRKTA